MDVMTWQMQILCRSLEFHQISSDVVQSEQVQGYLYARWHRTHGATNDAPYTSINVRFWGHALGTLYEHVSYKWHLSSFGGLPLSGGVKRAMAGCVVFCIQVTSM
jgi:hypothetical protein